MNGPRWFPEILVQSFQPLPYHPMNTSLVDGQLKKESNIHTMAHSVIKKERNERKKQNARKGKGKNEKNMK